MPDLSSLFTPNSGMHTAFVQVGLKEDHKVSSFAYMDQVRDRVARGTAGVAHIFSVRRPGGCGAEPGRSRADRRPGQRIDLEDRRPHRAGSGAAIPSGAGSLRRLRPAGHGLSGAAGERESRRAPANWGWSPKEVIDNLITSLTSDAMIAPSYWVDPKSGNNYFVTVQYPENQVKSIQDLKAMPLRAPSLKLPTYLNQVADVSMIQSPTEVDHYQLQRSHRRVRGAVRRGSRKARPRRSPKSSRTRNFRPIFASTFEGWWSPCSRPSGVSAIGLLLAVLLVYLILVAQFTSFHRSLSDHSGRSDRTRSACW